MNNKKAYDFSDLKYKLNLENILNNSKGKQLSLNNTRMFLANDDLKFKIQKNLFVIGTAWIFL
jgi:hypothetical protein